MTSPAGLTQRSRLAFLLKDSVIYGGAAAISKSFALVTFPILARQLTVVEYGVLDYFLVLASFMTLLFVFGQDSAVARFFYEHEDNEERRQLISQSLAFQFVLMAFFLPILWFSTEQFAGLLIDSQKATALFRIVLLQIPFLLFLNFAQNILKWTFQRNNFLLISLGTTFVQAVMLVCALLALDAGPREVLLINLFSSIVFSILGLWFVRSLLVWPRGFEHLRQMLPFAIPFGLICVLSAFLPAVERSLVSDFLGSSELGLYAAGAKIAMLVGILVAAFQTAWGPFSLSLYKQADAAQTYNAVLRIFTLFICCLVLGLTLAAGPLVHLLASDRYAGSVPVVFALAFGLAVQAIGWITEIGITLSKRSYLSLYGHLAALVVTLAAITLLAPRFGLTGVAYGVLSGHAARALLASILAQRAWPLAWQYRSVLLVIVITLAFGLISAWVGHALGEAARRLVIMIGLICIVGIGGRTMFTTSEIMRALEVVRRRLTGIPPGPGRSR